MTGALVLGFALQAVGFSAVIVAAIRFDRAGDDRNRLGYLVWGGILTCCAGTGLLVATLFLAAVIAARP